MGEQLVIRPGTQVPPDLPDPDDGGVPSLDRDAGEPAHTEGRRTTALHDTPSGAPQYVARPRTRACRRRPARVRGPVRLSRAHGGRASGGIRRRPGTAPRLHPGASDQRPPPIPGGRGSRAEDQEPATRLVRDARPHRGQARRVRAAGGRSAACPGLRGHQACGQGRSLGAHTAGARPHHFCRRKRPQAATGPADRADRTRHEDRGVPVGHCHLR